MKNKKSVLSIKPTQVDRFPLTSPSRSRLDSLEGEPRAPLTKDRDEAQRVVSGSHREGGALQDQDVLNLGRLYTSKQALGAMGILWMTKEMEMVGRLVVLTGPIVRCLGVNPIDLQVTGRVRCRMTLLHPRTTTAMARVPATVRRSEEGRTTDFHTSPREHRTVRWYL